MTFIRRGRSTTCWRWPSTAWCGSGARRTSRSATRRASHLRVTVAFCITGTASATRRGRSRSSTRSVRAGPRWRSTCGPAHRWIFDLTATAPVTFHEAACDTGVVQIDSLRPDVRRRWPRPRPSMPRRAARRARGGVAARDRGVPGVATFRRWPSPPRPGGDPRWVAATSPGTGSTRATATTGRGRLAADLLATCSARPSRAGGCRCTAASRRTDASWISRSLPARAPRGAGVRIALGCRRTGRSCSSPSAASARGIALVALPRRDWTLVTTDVPGRERSAHTSRGG